MNDTAIEVIDENVILPEDLQVNQEEAENLKKKVHDLIQNLSVSYFELSRYLGEIQNKKLYKVWGYSSVQDWVTTEFNFQRRKAYYFVNIDNYFNKNLKELLPEDKYDKTIETAREIGWSKASVIATQKILTPDNCEEVMDAAKNLSVDALTNKCRSIKEEAQVSLGNEDAPSPDLAPRMVSKSYKFTEYDKEIVDDAIGRAKEVMGDEKAKDGKALSFICADYDANAGVNIADYFSRIERILGLSLVAINDQNKKIVFGEDTMQRLAED